MADIATPLSPEMLEKYRCFYCKKYLSYGPVKMYPSGNIGCGRCSPTEGSPGTVSLYEKVAPYLVFPCIYQPQGCSVQLRHDEVKDHEEKCPRREFHCPFCPVKLGHTKSFLRKLSNHFESIHSDDFLKKPEFFLNINNFDITERNLFFSQQESMLCMLIFVEFDGQWLYINVSVPHGYGVDNFKQVVTNLGTLKYCSSLGDNSDCFKVFLPRALDCIAKIDFNIVGELIRITLSFLPKKIGPDDVLRIKSELDPSYIPDLYWDNTFKKLLEKNYGEIDFGAFSLDRVKSNIINIKNDNFLLSIKCGFCDLFMWESSCINGYYKCYTCTCNICHTCYSYGYSICKDDRNSFKKMPVEKQQFQASCRYGCGSYIDILRYKDHEKYCKFNVLRFLSESEMGTLCFGSVLLDASNFFMHKSIIAFKFIPTESKSCYIVTESNQKYVLHYTYKNEKHLFEVEHGYDKTKFIVVTRILCRNNTVREEQSYFHFHILDGVHFTQYDDNSVQLTCSIKIVNRNEIFKKLTLGSEMLKESNQLGNQ